MARLDRATHPARVGAPRWLSCARGRERAGRPGWTRPWRDWLSTRAVWRISLACARARASKRRNAWRCSRSALRLSRYAVERRPWRSALRLPRRAPGRLTSAIKLFVIFCRCSHTPPPAGRRGARKSAAAMTGELGCVRVLWSIRPI